VNLTPINGDPLRLTRTNGVVPGTKTLITFNEFKIALREYKGVISGGGGASKKPRQRLYTALLEGVACNAFDNETRNEPLFDRYCRHSTTEVSKCLAKLFPSYSGSVAKQNLALKNIKKVLDK
jgi:hypothetical protein